MKYWSSWSFVRPSSFLPPCSQWLTLWNCTRTRGLVTVTVTKTRGKLTRAIKDEPLLALPSTKEGKCNIYCFIQRCVLLFLTFCSASCRGWALAALKTTWRILVVHLLWCSSGRIAFRTAPRLKSHLLGGGPRLVWWFTNPQNLALTLHHASSCVICSLASNRQKQRRVAIQAFILSVFFFFYPLKFF